MPMARSAPCDRGAGDADREVQRVEMAAPHIEAAAMIVARGDHRGDFVALDGAKRRVSVMIAQVRHMPPRRGDMTTPVIAVQKAGAIRSEEHTSELQALMRNSYAGLCLKKK